MEKTLKVDQQDVRIRMSADILRVYRREFGRDLIVDMQKMSKGLDLEVIENLFYLSAKAVDPELPDIDTWLSQFSIYAMYMAAADLMEAWNEENETLSTPKKKVTP